MAALQAIRAITQAVAGKQSDWESVGLPIPDQLVIIATDTGAIKIGNGSDLYADLPILITIQDIIDASALVKTKADANTTLDQLLLRAPLNSPALTGTPTAPTPPLTSNDGTIATTAFVKSLGFTTPGDAASAAPVQSVAGRTGAVTLSVGDVAGAAPLNSPTLTGTVIAPTVAAATNNTQVATTAFVKAQNYVTASGASAAAPVQSVAGKSGAVSLVVGDVGGAAPLNSPALTGTPTAPTPTSASNDATIATTAFVKSLGFTTSGGASAAAPVQSVAGRTGAVTLAIADVAGAAPLASPALTGTPTAPTPATASGDTTIATTAFVKNQAYVTASGAASAAPVQSVAGRTGAVMLAVADVSGAAPLASPVLTGTPTAPTALVGDSSAQLATTKFVKDQAYVTASGASAAAPVQSVAGRTGAVTLAVGDVAGAAPLNSPTLTGSPKAPTPLASSSDTSIATTAFVKSLGFTTPGDASTAAPVQSVAGRTGDVVLAVADVAGAAPLASPALTGAPTTPTVVSSDSSTKIASTAYVKAQGYVTSSGAAAAAPVQSVAGRTGAVTLAVGDISGAAPLASPALTGTPTAPTPLGTSNDTTLATTAFVKGQSYVTASGASAAAPVQSVAGRTGAVVLSKSDVGLASVDNTADSAKAVLSASKLTTARTINGVAFDGTAAITINAVDSTARVASSEKGAANGVAPLGADAKIAATYLPSYVDDVLEYTNKAGFPATGETGKIYVDLTTNKTWRWSGSAYVEIAASPGSTDAVPEGSANLYFTTARASAAAPVQSVAGRTGAVTLAVGDVSGAAPLASPALTGTPTAPTPATADNGTKLATTAFVKAQNYVTASGAAGAAPVQSVAGRTGAVVLSKADVDLANVDNTADSAKAVASAAKLTTARTINGVAFDGSANITVSDATKLPLLGGTLAGNLTFSLDHQDFFTVRNNATTTNTTPFTWRVENRDWRLWMYGSDSVGRTAIQANVDTGVVSFIAPPLVNGVALPTASALANKIDKNTDIDLAGHRLDSALLRGSRTPYINLGTVSTGTVTIDPAQGHVQRLQIASNASVTLAIAWAAGAAQDLVLEVINGGAGVLSFSPPVSFIGTNGALQANPNATLKSDGTADLIGLISTGTVVYGRVGR